MLPSVAIIILNWNNWQDTITCVTACQKLEWPKTYILVVDNNSTNNSVETIRHHFPDLELIETGANLGFAGGNNIGIKQALDLGAEYIWLLNNDATPAPAALAPLVSALQNYPSAACAASKIYYENDQQRIWFAGGAWSKGRLRLRLQGAYQIDNGQFDKIRRIGSASGCSMLIPRSMFQTVGMLDERYFLYWEDTDWSARAHKQGYQILFVPDSHVWHKVSATITPRSELQYYYHTRNGLIFCREHDIRILPFFMLYLVADVSVGLFRGNSAMLRGFINGCFDFLRGRTGKRVTSRAADHP